tara:strand:- start:2016 stop:2900 length:885 start_codon:yes stop_codon:yes gene_type:complete
MREVDAFIVGVPKAGTTWLANVLSQHPEISLSDPKEPNIVASHRGTFGRSDSEPDLSEYHGRFKGGGLKLDASIHTFSCPVSPSRMASLLPTIPMILCIREPVSRAVSHWKMIRDTEEDTRNGANWSDFEVAWTDDRLRDDSQYGKSMERWLNHVSLDQFLILDSQRMRSEPKAVLSEVEGFLGLPSIKYDLNPSRHSNSASDRRPITKIGRIVRFVFSFIPRLVKGPIVKRLQERDINIYAAPLISKKADRISADSNHYSICGDSVVRDLRLFQSLTGFDTSEWVDKIESNRV